MKRYIGLPVIILLVACGHKNRQLPILGEPVVSGKDTVYPAVAGFYFTSQEGQPVTNQTFTNKIYVADFIFLSCPTICPKMTAEMHKAYKAFAGDNRVLFLSHTIDPQHDSIPRLKSYAAKLGVDPARWYFVTGAQDSIIGIAENSYFSTAFPDSTSPGGFTHSGGLLLVDKNRHIRGVYNGTKPEETERLIGDIKTLLKEQF